MEDLGVLFVELLGVQKILLSLTLSVILVGKLNTFLIATAILICGF
jgi:hypothetical protein